MLTCMCAHHPFTTCCYHAIFSHATNPKGITAACRQAALGVIQAAVTVQSSPATAVQPSSGPSAPAKEEDHGSSVHPMLAQWLPPAKSQVQTASTAEYLPPQLHQQLLQKAQSQLQALPRITQLCADVAAAALKLTPDSQEQTSHSVMLLQCLGILDGLAHQLKLQTADVVGNPQPKHAEKRVKHTLRGKTHRLSFSLPRGGQADHGAETILPNLSALADTVGDIER